MRKIAFLTCQKFPQCSDDDRATFDSLAEAGIQVVPAVWDDPAVDWASFEAVIARSTWDYHERLDEFQRWFAGFRALGVPMFNPASTIAWNMDKRYLLELEAQGVPILETAHVPAGSRVDLAQIMADRGWAEAVIKPAISAGSWQTVRLSRADAGTHQADLGRLLADRGALVQRFYPEIATDGEWSFFFFNRVYQYCVVKRPNPGDFRIHYANVTAGQPSPVLIEAAAKPLQQVEGPLLYARVDGLIVEGRLRLMELELFEPFLYMSHSPGAPAKFAAAIVERLNA